VEKIYHTIWPSIHNVAWCFCGGHNLKSGNSIHSSGMCRLSTRRNMAKRSRVQFQTSPASPHLVRRWIVVSVAWQRRQRPSSVRFILFRRSFVGVSSCVTAYQRDRTVKGRCLPLTFLYIAFHLKMWCFWCILTAACGRVACSSSLSDE
jgi:hypothetical protein